MLRRFLVMSVATAALALSAGIGFLAADWPFLHRLWRLPAVTADWRAAVPTPLVTIDGGSSPFFPTAAAGERTVGEEALAEAEAWARAHESAALLVLHRGKVQLERYWQGLGRDARYPAQSLSASLLGLLYGRALADGRIGSLDTSVDRWIEEWRGEPRGAITLRQLLWNVSGLEPAAADGPLGLLGKAGRLRYGTEIARAALSFDLAHEPGTHFAVSPVDAQLLGIVLERASGESYPQVVAHSLWRPIGAGVAALSLDRRGGMAAVFDGLSVAPGDLLRLGALLADDGAVNGRQVLPPGWIHDMGRGSMPNPQFGLGVRALDGEGLLMAGDGRAVWVWPKDELVIVRLGPAVPGWDAPAMPDILRRNLH